MVIVTILASENGQRASARHAILPYLTLALIWNMLRKYFYSAIEHEYTYTS